MPRCPGVEIIGLLSLALVLKPHSYSPHISICKFSKPNTTAQNTTHYHYTRLLKMSSSDASCSYHPVRQLITSS
ncbi:hypothetical protein B0J13DRAFT_577865 [Dactylonectria estremocensis]|uniref:Secreted protein n=1 Tax=Dactylonectria estremocensis TaxID=1079267 RepID=A0A9P9I810_9HYPO|nr:hypothetical protein B0J13DRAFT_577865 [Dactylonectria estremocensis]